MSDPNPNINNSSSNSNANNNNNVPFWKQLPLGASLLQKLATTTTPILTPPKLRSRDSLPIPPPGMEWVLSNDDDTNPDKKEWRLIKATSVAATTTASEPPELVAERNGHPNQTAPTSSATTTSHGAAPVTPCRAESTPSSELHNALRLNQNIIIDELSLLSSSSSSNFKPPLLPNLPPTSRNNSLNEDAWELLSDRISSSSNQTPTVILHQTIKASSSTTTNHSHSTNRNTNSNSNNNNNSSGSVRSLSSMENHNNDNLSNLLEGGAGLDTNHNIPYKIQRTTSSSTIDSSEPQSSYIGPLGKGILGVDYLEHVILPTDTLQGICIAYKISSTQLKLANHFSGNSLLLAPSKLVIPISKQALRSGYIRIQDTDQKEYKIHALLAEFPDFSMIEAKAYLELADWQLKDAIRSAKEDLEWEMEQNDNDDRHRNHPRDNVYDAKQIMFKSGEIRITPQLNHIGEPIGFHTKGAGILPPPITPKSVASTDPTSVGTNDDTTTATTNNHTNHGANNDNNGAVITTGPASAVAAYDIYAQHNNFGVELQSFTKK
jgi:LysM repeat protein